MNLSTECLEASQVDSLLLGNLTPKEYEAAQDHLERCKTCRSRVEATIGPEQWWSDVQSVLRSNASLQVAASLRDAEDFRVEEIDVDAASLGETRLSESVLDLLGPTDDPNMLGRIGPYEIIGLLGQGGMGAVFKGFDRSLNRFVAIKMLLPHLAASGAARKRFAREGQAVAAVVDDHVMAIHCVDEWQGVPYLVMTYSRGVSLQKRLSDNGPLEVREILRIGMQAAKGLAAAHAQGIVHRDIKPANIFLDQNVERVQLMDFGLARAIDDASLTRSGTLAGTPQYMSPEQARAETVDHRSDLFSLGSVMYAMCTGHAPFRAESSYSVLRLITDKEPRPIRELNPDVPKWLCTIIGKLMAKQADDRFSSAKEVAQLLEDCLAHVQQPTVKELPESLTQHLVPISGSSRPARLMQQFNRSGIRSWLLAGISVTAIMLIAMMLQDNAPQRVAQGTSGPLTGAQANLNELLQQQKAREDSIRQISYKGTVRQYAKQEIQRTNNESVDEFVARCVGLAPVYDDVPPSPLSAGRDFGTGVYRFTLGDINAPIPKYMDWFIDEKKFVQLMGRDPGACEAVITKNREDIQDDREASLVRLDIAAFRPVKDILMSEVLTKAISEPGIPDVGGRPLWKLEKLDNNKVGWKATFMLQQPIANPPGAKQILWHRVYWEQVGGELVIVRVDKLTVDGNESSTPQSVLLIDDYRSVCGKPVPFRVRCFVLGDSFVQGAELTVSDMKVNDYVDVPDQMKIPAGSPVRNHITGVKSRQPASRNSDPTTDAELIQGTWNVLELQQVGYEASEDERNIYKNGGYKITFTKNKTIHSPDHSSMDYQLDTTQTPHVLELLQSGKVIAKAIYELAGDDLKICQGRTPTDGSEPKPPTSFDIKHAAAGEFPTLMILRRTMPIEPVAIPMGVAAPEAATGTRASGPSGKQNPKRLQIREATVVEAETDSSLKPAENKVVEFSGMRLRLNPAQPAILTEDDIMTVESVTDPNNPKTSQIVLTLTPKAGERFLIETTRLSSQPNPGYLVIEFDGIVLSAPRVNDKISRKVAIAFAERDKINMERVVSAIRESIADRDKLVEKESNARSVVEAYVAAALAGDVAKAAALAKDAPADPKQIHEFPKLVNLQRLKIETVYVNDPAKPTLALATSAAVKLDEEHKNPDGRRNGFLVFTLELTDDKWIVSDIDFETDSGAEEELKQFLEVNPNSIGQPPQSQK